MSKYEASAKPLRSSFCQWSPVFTLSVMTGLVLVVDDEVQIRTVLRAYLLQAGFTVAETGRGADALNRVTAQPRPDLVLLDIGLPDIDGLEVLRTLRTRSEVPVILVTARAEEIDTLIGLSVGADDYITKPFSPREVVARVTTVLRRSGARTVASDPADLVLRFPLGAGYLTIDPERREVTVAGASVTLSALEFDLLLALGRHPGRVFSRSQLLEQVWGHNFFGDERVVDVHIRGMRNALGDSAASPLMIGTVRSVGYKFLLELDNRTPKC